MTSRQKILKLIYPFIILRSKLKSSNNTIQQNKKNTLPIISMYDIPFQLNNGSTITLSLFQNKRILITNTASDCGYTKQYDHLERLYKVNPDKLVVIAFPSNDFGKQEKGNDSDIAQFCKINYGVTFPIAKKTAVIKSSHQHAIFSWLSNANKNGWLNQSPTWNFCKYLINEQGVLTHYFESAVSPLSKEIRSAIEQ